MGRVRLAVGFLFGAAIACGVVEQDDLSSPHTPASPAVSGAPEPATDAALSSEDASEAPTLDAASDAARTDGPPAPMADASAPDSAALADAAPPDAALSDAAPAMQDAAPPDATVADAAVADAAPASNDGAPPVDATITQVCVTAAASLALACDNGPQSDLSCGASACYFGKLRYYATESGSCCTADKDCPLGCIYKDGQACCRTVPSACAGAYLPNGKPCPFWVEGLCFASAEQACACSGCAGCCTFNTPQSFKKGRLKLPVKQVQPTCSQSQSDSGPYSWGNSTSQPYGSQAILSCSAVEP